MAKRTLAAALASTIGLMVAAGLGPRANAAPVVLELFQSQGCSSCPLADANVNALADRPDVLVLSYGVTYWDNLGWKDTFASPQFTARQWSYAHGLHHNDVATPEVVIDGRSDLVGNDPRELAADIRTAPPLAGPAIFVVGRAVQVAAGRAPGAGADVWLVRYDPRTLNVAIRRGENGGKTLPHRDVVRLLTRLGHWGGAAKTYPLPAPGDPALKTAILVQAPDGGPILAAARF